MFGQGIGYGVSESLVGFLVGVVDLSLGTSWGLAPRLLMGTHGQGQGHASWDGMDWIY